MLRLVRTAFALVALAVATSLIGGAILAIIPWDPRRRGADRLGRAWAWVMLFACGVRLRVEGAERIDPRGRYVFISNHQSALDIPVLMAGLPNHFGFMAKQQLFDIPFFGAVLRRTGCVPVTREEEAKALRAVREAAKQLEGGESVVVFPEGTRSQTGEMLPFKGGGFLLAREAGRPIIPVAIDGTQRILHPRRLLLGRSGVVRVTLGDPVPAAGRRRTELAAQTRAWIEANLHGVHPAGAQRNLN